MSVAIRKSKEIKKALNEIFHELGFHFGKRVFVKPNLCGRDPILPGENTSIEVMDALVEILLEKQCKIIIGHDKLLNSKDVIFSFDDLLKNSGFKKYNKMENVKMINLDDLERTRFKTDELTFNLPVKFLKNEVDTYINLAKIKTHMETDVSLSLKNQMGLPSPEDRVMMHKTNLEKTIAKLALYCKPDLNILEGFPAMEGNGPHHGTPIDLDIIAASRDMVELDSFLSELLGYNSKDIKHIRYASEYGVGKYYNIEKISDFKEYLVNDFKKAEKVYRFGTRLFAYPTYSCSRCISAVNLAGREFKKHPFKYWRVIWKAIFSRKKINIVFGKADNLELDKNDKFICVGNCSKGFSEVYHADCLDKCPPGVEETRKYLVKKISEK